VDKLGGFWTAAGEAAALAKVPESDMVFRIYPKPKGLLAKLSSLSGGLEASLGLFGRIESLLNLPIAQALMAGAAEVPGQTPGGMLQLKAAHLPRP
jgi:hypothetical protein